MPITVAYNPDIALSGEVAYQSGRGKYLQAKDRYDYERSNADREYDLKNRSFEEGQRQFNQRQAYNVDLAQLKNRQFNRQLGQQAYQFDAGLDSREQLAQSGIDARLEQQQLRQQGQADYLAGQGELQQKGIEARERAALTSKEEAVVQKFRDQRFLEGVKAADLVERFPFRKPEQKQQSIEEWEKLYGRDYPYNLPAQESPELFSLEQAGEQLKAAFGDMYEPGIENLFGTVVDGEYRPDEKPRPAATAWVSLKRTRIMAETQQAMAAATAQSQHEKAQDASKKNEAKQISDFVGNYSSWITDREQWVDKQLKGRVDEDSDTGFRGGTQQGLIDIFRQEYLSRFSHALPSPSIQAEFDALPPGALFRGSDGKIRTK